MGDLRRSFALFVVVILTVGCGKVPVGLSGQTADGSPPDTSGATPAVDVVAPTPDAETVAQRLQDGGAKQQLAAAWSLPDREDIPLDQRVDLLVSALDQEASNPTQGPPPVDSYLPASSLLGLHYARALADLGPDAVPALRAAADDASGEVRQHLLIALLDAGDRDILPQVRDLVMQASDPAVRMDAARALGQAEDSEAVSQLEAALGDTYVVSGTDDLGSYTLYPVREQAAGALRALGMTVTRNSDDTFGVGE